jgi:hypothetical protein
MIHSSFTTTVLWQGDQFRTVKTFGARPCQLCTREKVAIVLETQRKSACVIDSRLDLDGACPHHLKFHRFSFCASTDEDFYPEKESSTSLLVPSLSDSCASESESMDDFQGLACVVKIVAGFLVYCWFAILGMLSGSAYGDYCATVYIGDFLVNK